MKILSRKYSKKKEKEEKKEYKIELQDQYLRSLGARGAREMIIKEIMQSNS